MKLFFSILFSGIVSTAYAGDSTAINKKLSTQSLLNVKTQSDSISYTTPKFKQGFFCNFEDKLNRKKVPVDFSLGKSKY